MSFPPLEKCLEKISNRYLLVVLTAKPSRQPGHHSVHSPPSSVAFPLWVHGSTHSTEPPGASAVLKKRDCSSLPKPPTCFDTES